jgi:putative protease
VRLELLAPAGDRDCVAAAVENGADAVYFGLTRGFNARARSANFPIESVAELMTFLRRRGVKGYLTLNTLVFPSELAEVEQTIRQVAAAGVDALLVQDLGLARLVRGICPDMPIHASTQMTLTSAECIEALREFGIERVVLPRELSIDEIRAIHRGTGVRLEAFVHGALCVAYSGQCLTSESIGGRSANRGQCAQACRMTYELVCDGQDVDLREMKYLLSPQDLAAYDLIPELIAAGVSAFKIEGRLKTAEYVAAATRHYRQAIETAMAGMPVELAPRDVEEMEVSFSRGFSHGWLQGCDHKALVPGLSSSKRGVYLGQVTAVGRSRVEIELAASIKRGDGIVFEGDRSEDAEQGGRVYEVFQDGRSVEGSVAAGRVELAFAHDAFRLDQIVPGQKLWKTDDPEIARRLRKSFSGATPQRRVPLEVSVEAAVGRPLVIEARASSGAHCRLESPQALEEARKHPLTAEMLAEQLGRLGGTVYQLQRLDARVEGQPMIPLSVLGKLRHALVEQLDASLAEPPPRTIAAEPVLPGLRESMAGAAGEHVFPRSEAPLRNASPRSSASSSCGATQESLDTSSKRSFGEVCSQAGAWEQGREAGAWEQGREAGASEQGREAGASEQGPDSQPQIHVLCRSLAQLQAVLECGVRSVMVDFQDIRQYREAVQQAHAAGAEILLATPRIEKPAELGIFRVLEKHPAEGILVRNLAGLAFFRELPLRRVADFSLNAANELSAQWLRAHGADRVTACYDMNRDQLLDLVRAVPPEWLEVVIHQHMPLFHMEHCVFCATLSPGTDKTNCGRPCDRHTVELRDRIGMLHPLTADVGCRNTLFNARPQSAAEAVPLLLERGVRHFRVELLRDAAAAETARIVGLYRDLLAGRVSGSDVWRQLRAANRVGVTRGTLEERRNPQAIV